MAIRLSRTRRRALPGLGAALVLAVTLHAGSAGAAVITTSSGQKVGVMPQVVNPYAYTTASSGTSRFDTSVGPLTAHGGPVLHGTNTYALYWDPNGAGYPDPYPVNSKLMIDQFLQDVGRDSGQLSNLFALNPQYTDSAGRAGNTSVFRGAYSDTTTPYPTSGCTDPLGSGSPCLTTAQVQAEVQNLVAARGLPHGLGTVYFLMTGPKAVVCTDATAAVCSDKQSSTAGLCGFHSYAGSATPPYADTLLYAVIPYGGISGSPNKACQADGLVDSSLNPIIQLPNATRQDPPNQTNLNTYIPDLADIMINALSHEMNAMVTDPLLNAWQDVRGQEAPDKCLANGPTGAPAGYDPAAYMVLVGSGGGKMSPEKNTTWGTLYNQPIGGGIFYLHSEWNQAQSLCSLNVQLEPRFVAPNAVNVGDVVSFDATSTLATLNVANYSWSFGDGSGTPPSPVSTPSTVHAFTAGGVYTVVLNVTDGGGNQASFAQTILVIGPPPPPVAAPVTSSPGGSSGAPVNPAPTSAGPGRGPGGHLLPVVVQTIGSSSLRKALHGGLSVRYGVNESVAGRFDVLLDQHTAKRLRIGGATTAGFGSAAAGQRSVVIGSAVLVTTRAGHNGLSISLSRTATRRLSHVSSLSIALRVSVSDDFGQRFSAVLQTTLRH